MEKIDNLDKKILEIITANARIPFKDVAEECGVSRAAIHQRVQRLIDLGVIRSMFGTEGVKVYIDDSADFKVKISLDVNAWLDLFASDIMDIITMTCGITISEEDMLENSKFNHADYFLQFDKQTKQLLGYGSKFDLSFDINFQTDNVSADIGYDMNRNSWMVKSDVPAAELPEDTDSYENITGGLF